MKEILIRSLCTLLLIIPILLVNCNKEESLKSESTTQLKAMPSGDSVVDLVKDCTFNRSLRFRSTSLNIPYDQAEKKVIEKAIANMHRLIQTNQSIPHIRENFTGLSYIGITVIKGQSYEVKVQENENFFNLQLGYYY